MKKHYINSIFIRKSNIEILIDTSESVDDNLIRAFLKECKNIFDEYSIKIGCFDTQFYGFTTINKKDDLDKFIIQGRGGTDFTVAANSFTKKSNVKIIFTDGMDLMPSETKDIIWMIY
jgi:predicted metal-dependent peptidase